MGPKPWGIDVFDGSEFYIVPGWRAWRTLPVRGIACDWWGTLLWDRENELVGLQLVLCRRVREGSTNSDVLALLAAGGQAECVMDSELGRVVLVRVRLVFLNFVEWPWKDRLWGGDCRLALASFAKRLCDQQGLEGAHYLVKAGRGGWSKRLQREGSTIDCRARCLGQTGLGEIGVLTRARVPARRRALSGCLTSKTWRIYRSVLPFAVSKPRASCGYRLWVAGTGEQPTTFATDSSCDASQPALSLPDSTFRTCR